MNRVTKDHPLCINKAAAWLLLPPLLVGMIGRPRPLSLHLIDASELRSVPKEEYRFSRGSQSSPYRIYFQIAAYSSLPLLLLDLLTSTIGIGAAGLTATGSANIEVGAVGYEKLDLLLPALASAFAMIGDRRLLQRLLVVNENKPLLPPMLVFSTRMLPEDLWEVLDSPNSIRNISL
ncbi:hypothetical protein SUGI_1493880 [Cryptomeria japonica]|uniref:Uncharacterized protein n=1 Tax=Cryptomeria japonica TaxID=3369 RepID=A0AAD3NTV5_CRYJA|nr:hypothetical protein SUGI_1373550 [Cryptomeria japonica]GLJ59133.1 hypothetical protein SUGI_1493880 [Cryptomeria japonica]